MTSPRFSPTPAQYQIGAVKQDPSTLATATRTAIVDPDNAKDWGVMTVDRGGDFVPWDQVSGWKDMVQK
jgi:hypothetical protein